MCWFFGLVHSRGAPFYAGTARAHSEVRNMLLPLPSKEHSDGGAEADVQSGVQSHAEWVRDIAIAGPVGVLALVGLWEPIVEMADRWADDGSPASTLPLTVFLGVLFLAVVILLGTICWGQKRWRCHLWRAPRAHLD